MNLRIRSIGAGAALAATALLASSGAASAAFPDFANCPTSNPNIISCVDIQARGGTLNIKSTRATLGESLRIRGGIVITSDGLRAVLAPPSSGGNGVIGRPVAIPGGLLGIDFPIPGNAVTATAQLAGPSSNVQFNLANLQVSIPLKLKLTNPLIGPNCQIGSDSNPARLVLSTGTTSPPAPNRPITGRAGSLVDYGTHVVYTGNIHVDNSFSVPDANNCGFFGGIFINPLVNLKVGLPSSAGNNTMIVNNDLALAAPF